MAVAGDELNDVWEFSDGKAIAAGDAKTIDALLATKLEKIRTDTSGWVTLYRDRESGIFWELSYPKGEIHGGGPRRLRCLGYDVRKLDS